MEISTMMPPGQALKIATRQETGAGCRPGIVTACEKQQVTINRATKGHQPNRATKGWGLDVEIMEVFKSCGRQQQRNRLRQFELQRKSETRDHLKTRQYKMAQGHGINRKMKKKRGKRNQHEEQKRRDKLKALSIRKCELVQLFRISCKIDKKIWEYFSGRQKEYLHLVIYR
jgi:hypothetical protein